MTLKREWQTYKFNGTDFSTSGIQSATGKRVQVGGDLTWRPPMCLRPSLWFLFRQKHGAALLLWLVCRLTRHVCFSVTPHTVPFAAMEFVTFVTSSHVAAMGHVVGHVPCNGCPCVTPHRTRAFMMPVIFHVICYTVCHVIRRINPCCLALATTRIFHLYFGSFVLLFCRGLNTTVWFGRDTFPRSWIVYICPSDLFSLSLSRHP